MSISILYGYVNIYFYTSGDHCLTSKLFESNRQHSSSNEKEEKGKERKKRFPWSRAVVLRWAQRSSRTWRTGIGHYEIVSGVPASRRAVVVPTCHRIAAQSSVGATRLARGSQLHYRAPSVTPRWFASVALCFCIRTRSFLAADSLCYPLQITGPFQWYVSRLLFRATSRTSVVKLWCRYTINLSLYCRGINIIFSIFSIEYAEWYIEGLILFIFSSWITLMSFTGVYSIWKMFKMFFWKKNYL